MCQFEWQGQIMKKTWQSICYFSTYGRVWIGRNGQNWKIGPEYLFIHLNQWFEETNGIVGDFHYSDHASLTARLYVKLFEGVWVCSEFGFDRQTLGLSKFEVQYVKFEVVQNLLYLFGFDFDSTLKRNYAWFLVILTANVSTIFWPPWSRLGIISKGNYENGMIF